MLAAELRAHAPSLELEIIQIKTSGDAKQGTSRAADSDKRDWIHELELALLDGSIDLAIHSGKDVPAVISEQTMLLPVLPRENPFDVFIGKSVASGARLKFAELPSAAAVGTASLRRSAQLRLMRPDLKIVEVRGNVTTRVQKLEESQELMGIVLAAAGLNRLGLSHIGFEILPSPACLPAVNQGVLAAHLRRDQFQLIDILRGGLVEETCHAEFLAERACVNLLDADCKSAVSIFARCTGLQVALHAKVMLPDGSKVIEERLEDTSERAEQLGRTVAEQLIKRGALEILAESRRLG